MITEEQRERVSREMKKLDETYAILDEYHKLYKEGKTNTPKYIELREKLENLLPTKKDVERKKSKSTKPKRCNCKK